MDQLQLTHNATEGRYEGWLGETRVGFADAKVVGEVVEMPHTEVDPAYQGRGYAAEIVKFALDDIKASGRRVKPLCPYVARYIADQAAYQDLL